MLSLSPCAGLDALRPCQGILGIRALRQHGRPHARWRQQVLRFDLLPELPFAVVNEARPRRSQRRALFIVRDGEM